MSESKFPTGDKQLDEILAEYLRAMKAGTAPMDDELVARHPKYADRLREFLADKRWISEIAALDTEAAPTEAQTLFRSPTRHPANVVSEEQETESRVLGIDERYELTRLHNTGGMGQVWLALDKTLQRYVALKELRPECAKDDKMSARFLLEAQVTGQLEHPGIVPVYELSKSASGKPFYTMRFVNGRTLTEAARDYHDHRATSAGSTFDLLTLLNSFVAVCRTVAYGHSRDIVHRDLKGQNIVLGDFGEAIVLDWGLAKQISHADVEPQQQNESDVTVSADPSLTLDGQAIGTPAFMSPEQAAGRINQIDHRTDVYGLGAILYEILTGEPPFSGTSTYEILQQVLNEVPNPPSRLNEEIPPLLEAACLKALSKRPSDRHASANDLADEVERWQEVQLKKAEKALRDSEALHRSLVDMLPLMLTRKDLEGRITFANKCFCQSLGLPLEDIVGKTDFDFCPAKLAEKYQQDDHTVIETGETLETTEENTDTGNMRYVRVIKTPIYDSHSNCTGVQIICWDVSETKQLRENLNDVTTRLAVAQRRLKELGDSNSTHQ